MPIVVQLKGKEHCKKIKQEAWEIWRSTPIVLNNSQEQFRPFSYYLKKALENHRQLVEDQIKMEQCVSDPAYEYPE